ncbi:ATP-binding cassette sub- G member 8 [Mortierella sp. NVP41]|nr:ATP-binding cassette sub- G member 8 [Mortierella sp. NVP41]
MVRALKVSGKGERLGIFSKKTNFYHPSLRETLNFAAKLRLPVTTKQERQEVVESLLSTLGLKDCADVRVGDPDANEAGDGGMRGISKGERRRFSAAIHLLRRPDLLLCDEATSGLDSFTSFELVKTLNTYAKTSNKTVVLSIHQLRSEI